MEGLKLCCPSCGWEPKPQKLINKKIFWEYPVKHIELVKIRCNQSFCGFYDMITEWIMFD